MSRVGQVWLLADAFHDSSEVHLVVDDCDGCLIVMVSLEDGHVVHVLQEDLDPARRAWSYAHRGYTWTRRACSSELSTLASAGRSHELLPRPVPEGCFVDREIGAVR